MTDLSGRSPRATELKQSLRTRGVTWTMNGAEIILATQESASDLVLHELRR